MNNNLFTILGLTTTRINWFPTTVFEEIIQNVAVLMTTVVGTVTLDRRLGIMATFIDEPIPRGMMQLSIFLLETIQEYEPRVEVLEVDFAPNPVDAMDGKLYPRVKVRILDEYLS